MSSLLNVLEVEERSRRRKTVQKSFHIDERTKDMTFGSRTISNYQDIVVKVSHWTSLCLVGICKAYAFITQSL